MDGFAEKSSTNIYKATSTKGNEYIAESVRFCGYDLLKLVEKKSFTDVIFLLLSGEFPDEWQKKLLNQLMVSFINLGPQHPAIRAAMTAGICKSNTEHLLPIGLMVLGGSDCGVRAIESSYEFISTYFDSDPSALLTNLPEREGSGDIQVFPGFGSFYGGKDLLTDSLGSYLVKSYPKAKSLAWAKHLSDALLFHDMGWLPAAVTAAAGIDLGLGKRETMVLFQLMCGPGIAAQAVEQTHKPIKAMPFLSDSAYHYEK